MKRIDRRVRVARPDSTRTTSGARVAAVYDFDYLNRQARARDLCDLFMFFAAARPAPLDGGDITAFPLPAEPTGAGDAFSISTTSTPPATP